jgi:transcriptional regulator with XRE-family HTH domain
MSRAMLRIETKNDCGKWLVSVNFAWMKLAERIAANVRPLIAKRGWSEREFADKVGVERTVLSRWLNARSAPSLANVDKMADALGVSVETLTKDPEAVAVELHHDEISSFIDMLASAGHDVEKLAKSLKDSARKVDKLAKAIKPRVDK